MAASRQEVPLPTSCGSEKPLQYENSIAPTEYQQRIHRWSFVFFAGFRGLTMHSYVILYGKPLSAPHWCTNVGERPLQVRPRESLHFSLISTICSWNWQQMVCHWLNPQLNFPRVFSSLSYHKLYSIWKGKSLELLHKHKQCWWSSTKPMNFL